MFETRLLRVGPVVAAALPAIGKCRDRVFGEAQAVGEETQAMAGEGFGVFINVPADTLFGQQAGNEGAPQRYFLLGVVGFAVLDAVAARPGVGQEAGDFFAPIPVAPAASKQRYSVVCWCLSLVRK